jgi:hypothetical protein
MEQCARNQGDVRQRRVEAAVLFCSEVLEDDWHDAVAERLIARVSADTWHRLLGSRHQTRCDAVSGLAKHLLLDKKALQDVVASVLNSFAAILGLANVVQTLATELARSYPLPVEGQVVATGRGLQVTGILICLDNGDDLRQCQCFIDLALDETKTRVKAILIAATDDWTHLAEFPPKPVRVAC